MKNRFLFILLLIFTSISALAQKRYVTVVCYTCQTETGTQIYLSGDIPSNMKAYYSSDDYEMPRPVATYEYMGNVLNLLSENGFTCEQMNTGDSGRFLKTIFLFSKDSPDSPTPNSIEKIGAEDDSDVYEVARYNLQGMPINESEKGIQIIVYSNYTTKTIIKE